MDLKEHTRPARYAVIALLVAVALVVGLRIKVRSLEWREKYPALSLKDPTRDLFLFVERERRVAQASSWRLLPNSECRACAEDAASARFDELLVEQRRYAAAGNRRHRGKAWLREATAARAVALAGWGRRTRIEELRAISLDHLPNYLAERAVEILRADPAPEAARIARAGASRRALEAVTWGLALFAVAAVLAWRRGYDYPRRQARARLAVPTLGRGLLVFVGVQAFAAACVRLAQEYPDTLLEGLRVMPSVPTAVAAVALFSGTRTSVVAAPVAALCSCPKDSRSRRAIWVAAVAVLGIVVTFRLLLTSLASRFGIVTDWSEGVSEVLCTGSSTDVVLRAIDLIVVAPFGEELAYRGALFGGLSARMRPPRAAIVSAAVFALMHGYGLVGSSAIFVGSYLRARLSSRTGTLMPAILEHGLNNALAVAWQLTLH